MGNPNGGLRHGHGKQGCQSLTYKVWRGMRARCNRPKHKDWPHYGGKGIKVCPRWDSYEAFLSDMGPRETVRHTIDRLNPRDDYKPENCRWVLQPVQAMENKTTLRSVTIDGVFFHSIRAACRQYGVSPTTVNMRLKSGYDLITAITTPTRSLPNKRPRKSYLPKDKNFKRERDGAGRFA